MPRQLQRGARVSALANHEIVAIAVYLLGGGTKPIDTEDVAVKANELAPGRFSWRKYSEQINLEIIRVYLSDAKKQTKGAYLSGSGTDGWVLTQRGLAFAKKSMVRLASANLSREIVGPREKRWRRAERARLLNSSAFQKCASGSSDSVNYSEAAAFFRIDDYVSSKMREKRVTRIVNAFGGDPVLRNAILTLAEKVKGGLE